MLQYNPSISGSLSVTGSLIVTNGVIGTVSGVDVQIFSSSINQVITGIQSATGSQSGRLTSIESFTSSVSTTNTFTASASARLNSIETITASNVARLTSLEITSASVDILNTAQNTRLTNLENKTGSLATTGSNTFYGQQVFSGSLYVQNDLIVQGSSSLQNITASAVSIGTNIVNLNTANPAVRWGGISVQDSGSANGVTGSMLWDSTCNRWVYANPSGVGYSGGIIMSGPRAATLGSEITLTCNYIAKSGGGDHLYDSCIWEMSGSVGINTNNPTNSALHIVSDWVSGNSTVKIQPKLGGTTAGLGVYDDTGTRKGIFYRETGYVAIETAGAEPLLLNTNGIERLRISSNGCITLCTNTLSLATPSKFGYASDYQVLILGNTNNGQTKSIAFGVDVSGNTSPSFSGYGNEYIWRCAGSFITPNSVNNGYNTIFNWNSGGCSWFSNPLGIGLTSPTSTLHVKSVNDGFRLESACARGTGQIYFSFGDPTGRKGYLGYGSGTSDLLVLSNDMNAPVAIYTNDTKRIDIAATGITTFCCQIQTAGVSIGTSPFANVLTVRGENSAYDGTISIGARSSIQHRDSDQTTLSITNDYASNTARMEFRMKGNVSACSKITLFGDGVTCFANSICTPGISITSNPIGIEYLIIAGGGGGGWDVGGGGGAGGVLNGSTGIWPGTYAIGIGGGGSGAGTGAPVAPNNGYNTYAIGLMAIGGGGGGNYSNQGGTSGGSGGGGAGYGATTNGGLGMTGQGYAGGCGLNLGSNNSTAGGGGGAGGVGQSSISNITGYANGGAGILSTIIGETRSYGCGGRGGGDSWTGPMNNGTANTGGGGDGAGIPNTGCSGGSGIVILKMKNTNTATFSGGLTTYTCTNLGTYNIYVVTAGAGTVTIA
jgi:hypothetical protein